MPAYTKQLMIYRKRWLTPELMEQVKRQRRDFKESERLKLLALEKEKEKEKLKERQA